MRGTLSRWGEPSAAEERCPGGGPSAGPGLSKAKMLPDGLRFFSCPQPDAFSAGGPQPWHLIKIFIKSLIIKSLKIKILLKTCQTVSCRPHAARQGPGGGDGPGRSVLSGGAGRSSPRVSLRGSPSARPGSAGAGKGSAGAGAGGAARGGGGRFPRPGGGKAGGQPSAMAPAPRAPARGAAPSGSRSGGRPPAAGPVPGPRRQHGAGRPPPRLRQHLSQQGPGSASPTRQEAGPARRGGGGDPPGRPDPPRAPAPPAPRRRPAGPRRTRPR